jgi:sulfur-oxidizing protein SoxA
MVTLQGFTPAEARKDPFGGPGKKVAMDALVAYVTSQSRGMKMNVGMNHPKEKEAFEVGREIFLHRSGPYDFGCVTCHGFDSQRIRLQDLPNLLKTSDAQKAYTAWPAYRVSQGELRGFQWRLEDCFRQQRLPHLEFVSPASVALTMFLARNANGGVFNAPSIKR